MDIKKMYRFIAIFTALLCLTIIPFLILFFTGIVTPFICGFGVDKLDRIYIGTKNEIRVYVNGQQVDAINLAPIDAYTFTLNNSGNILLATPSNVYIMDTEGNILDKQQDRVGDTYHQMQYKKFFTSSNGDEYKLVCC